MNTPFRHWLASTAAALILSSAALSTDVYSAEAVAAAEAVAPAEATDPFSSDEYRRPRSRNGIVAFSNDAVLKSGETADEVVAIFGNASSDGTVQRELVAILGDARVTGPVGREVVAVFGNVYINSTVDREVVAVMGNVELGPEARIGRDVVAVGGTLKRDPAAIINGSTQIISLGPFDTLEGFKIWLRRCALLGRPLALDAGLGWAWGIAAGFLALYLLLGFAAPAAIQQCVTTLEQRPGRSLLAALIAVPVVPMLSLLLVMTIVGIVAIPFIGVALLCASVFGKAVMLAWIGRRITKPIAAMSHADAATEDGPSISQSDSWSVPLAVLIGGAIVTVLYLVPVLGFVVYKLLGFVGLGAVLYTLLASWQSSRASKIGTSGTAVDTNAPGATAQGMAMPIDATGDATATPAASVASQPIAHAGMPRAGFLLRMAALALDLVLVLVLTHLVTSPFGVGTPWMSTLLLWTAVYGALMWRLKGTTIGGSICGLQLVRQDGRAIDWGTAIMRALGCFLSLIVGGLGFIWIAFDKDQQAWHDKVAGTVVVRAPKGVPIM
ncbi:MAG: RDD family protein [Steroidobacteraceae bacterium]